MPPTPTRPRGAAVVTGASSGIGLAFARDLVRRGHPVLAVGRRRERLLELERWARDAHALPVIPVVADLATDEGLRAVAEALESLPDAPEVLVLNAGFGTRGRFVDIAPGREAEMVRVNCLAVADLAARAVPRMAAAGRGAVVVVSSAAAFQPIPHMAGYAATKAFERHFAEALSHELRGSGVRAVAVCPGPVRTEFSTSAGSKVRVPGALYEEPETVVRAAWRALARGRAVVPVGVVARAASAAGRVLPRAAVVAAAGAIHRVTRPADGAEDARREELQGSGG